MADLHRQLNPALQRVAALRQLIALYTLLYVVDLLNRYFIFADLVEYENENNKTTNIPTFYSIPPKIYIQHKAKHKSGIQKSIKHIPPDTANIQLIF